MLNENTQISFCGKNKDDMSKKEIWNLFVKTYEDKIFLQKELNKINRNAILSAKSKKWWQLW